MSSKSIASNRSARREESLSARLLRSGPITWLYSGKRIPALFSGALTLGILFVTDQNSWVNYWAGKWFALLVLAHLLFSVFVARRLGGIAGAAFLYFGVVLLIAGTSPWATHFTWGQHGLISHYARYALYGYATLLAAAGAVLTLPRWYPGTWVLVGIWGASIACTLKQAYDGVTPWARVGVSGNASMNGCLIAALTPLLMRTPGIGLGAFIVSVCTILLTGTSQPVLILAGVSLLYAAHYFSRSGKLTLVGFLGLIILAAYGLSDDDFFRSNNRVENWKHLGTWWTHTVNPLTGTHGDSGLVLFEQLQIKIQEWGGPDLRSMSGTYFWLHSDWLQIPFEYGLIGLVLALALYAQLFWAARTRPALQAVFLGFGGMMLANYPLRSPIHVLALVVLAWEIVYTRPRSASS